MLGFSEKKQLKYIGSKSTHTSGTLFAIPQVVFNSLGKIILLYKVMGFVTIPVPIEIVGRMVY